MTTGSRLLRAIVPIGLLVALIACGAGGDDEPAVPGVDPDPLPTSDPVEPPPPAAGMIPVAFEDLRARAGAAPGQVTLTFRAPPSGSAAQRYDVRVQVPHLSPDSDSTHYAGHAPTWPLTHTPRAPGETETVTLAGLEAGQTFQIAVRAVYADGPGPFSHGVGVRVPGPLHPAPPADAIAIDGPRSLDAPGYYLLTQDIATPGTAFTIRSQDVTLDLGGHTVIYGTAPGRSNGVYCEYLTEPGHIEVRNGTLRQGAGNGTDCPGIHFRAGYHLRFSGLTVEAHGNDTSPILIYDNPRGTLRIDHCRVAAKSTVVADRHFPGVAAIWLGAITESVEIDHNEITASPQWGIKLQGNASNGTSWIHHNRIVGTKSLVANAYMIGVHKAKTDVFENECVGESRGIHLDGQDNFGHDCEVHDNVIRAQDLPNSEYPVHWTHGIKVESARNAHVHHNAVHAIGDADHAAAYALDVSLGAATGVRIHDNRFHATSDHGPFVARAFSWSGGADAAPAGIEVRHNVFRATDEMIHRGWAALQGGTFRDNVWERDLAKGPQHNVVFERIDVSDQWPSPGHRLVDPHTTLDTTILTHWANPAAFDTERWATLTCVVVDASGAPIPGAQVRVTDRSGSEVAQGATDADGRARAALRVVRITNGPTVDRRGPFTLEVSSSQGTFRGTQAVDARAAVRVVLAETSVATQITLPPNAPEGLHVHALSASRLRARWTAVEDPIGIVAYEVVVGGVVVAYTDATSVVVSGLAAGTRHEVRVRAINAANLVSPLTDIAAAVLPVDDRGP